MPRFLIEVPHEEDRIACAQAVKVFLSTGSHFLTNADWGCYDGEHKAWIFIETDSKEDAQSILPSAFRSRAKVTQLGKFTMEEADNILMQHHKNKTETIDNNEQYEMPR
ncbi:MAG: hypothetical protein GF353_22415 [Candidatus Lokiarchaeota archaeon]|nr:hypothetical protein [Candidatus Lokiarchaeota archaeon]